MFYLLSGSFFFYSDKQRLEAFFSDVSRLSRVGDNEGIKQCVSALPARSSFVRLLIQKLCGKCELRDNPTLIRELYYWSGDHSFFELASYALIQKECPNWQAFIINLFEGDTETTDSYHQHLLSRYKDVKPCTPLDNVRFAQWMATRDATVISWLRSFINSADAVYEQAANVLCHCLIDPRSGLSLFVQMFFSMSLFVAFSMFLLLFTAPPVAIPVACLISLVLLLCLPYFIRETTGWLADRLPYESNSQTERNNLARELLQKRYKEQQLSLNENSHLKVAYAAIKREYGLLAKHSEGQSHGCKRALKIIECFIEGKLNYPTANHDYDPHFSLIPSHGTYTSLIELLCYPKAMFSAISSTRGRYYPDEWAEPMLDEIISLLKDMLTDETLHAIKAIALKFQIPTNWIIIKTQSYNGWVVQLSKFIELKTILEDAKKTNKDLKRTTRDWVNNILDSWTNDHIAAPTTTGQVLDDEPTTTLLSYCCC